MSVSTKQVCPNCGASLGHNALEQLCPACLLQMALGEASDDPDRKQVEDIPGYVIEEEIGRGGMGIVFRAIQVAVNREVALKMLLGLNLKLRQRFRFEIESIGNLQHQNIIPIHEVGEFEGKPFFSMKLIESGSVADRMEEFRPTSGHTGADARQRIERIVKLMIGVAEGVHHAHQCGIIHRDLKPGNILLDSDDHPYVSDFGVAKRADQNSGATQTGEFVGTPAYMSPEQANGKTDAISTATDIFSLGAVLYHLLAGRPPVHTNTTAEALLKISTCEFKPPSAYTAGIPRDLEVICLRCLHQKPERRYPSAKAFADDLGRWRRNEPIIARPISGWERAIKWAGRNPASAALLLVVALAAMGFVGLLEHSRSNLRVERDHAQAQEAIARDALALMDYQLADAAFEQGDAATAMAYLANVLRQNPSNHVAAERLLFALSHRQFALPAASPFQHQAAVIAAEFGPEDRFVMTVSRDGVVKFRHLDSPGEATTSLAIGFPIRSAALSRGGEAFIVGGMNGEVEIWSVDERRQKHRFQAHDTPVTHVEFDGAGLRALSHAGGIGVPVMDVQTGKELCLINEHERAVLFACFSPDGRMVLTGGTDDKARLWEADTGALISGPIDHLHYVNDGCFSPDGQRFATADERHLVHVYDLSGRRVVGPIRHYRPVLSVRFSNDGSRLVTGQRYERRARVWDAKTGEALSDALQVNGNVTWAGFSPRGLRIATLSSGNTVQLWNGFDYRKLGEPIIHDQPVESVRFSRDGNHLLTTSHNNAARLWDIRFSHPHKVGLRNFNAITEAAFSPDGKSVATASTDGLIVVWNSATGQRRTKMASRRP